MEKIKTDGFNNKIIFYFFIILDAPNNEHPIIKMKKILFLIITALSVSGCKTNLVYISVKDPAPVTIPGYIKRVGIVNRSQASDETKNLNKMHEIVSMETPTMTKEGSEECMKGLKDALVQNTRFDQVNLFDSIRLNSPGAGIFASPLSWDIVDKICRINNVDAIFVLELFDTELKVAPVSIPTDLSKPLNVLEAVQQQVNMTTIIKTGWRIYDPQNKIILDEFPISQNNTFTGSGVSAAATAEAMMGRKEAVKQTANRMGRIYADRILPYWVRVNRDYYVKGNYNFKIAKRKARTGNWDGAAELWQKETTNRRNKIAGRACYNMAIINEINGNLDDAIKWAQKAYEDHNNHLALHYVNILKNRRLQSNRLKSQEE